MGDLLLEDNNDNSNNNLVQSLVDKFRDAFNNHDPKMLGSLLTEARLDVKSYRSKWITDEIVSVDIKWESSGHRTPEGKPIPTIRYGLLNLIAKKVKEDEVDTQSDRERIVKQKW